MTGFRSRTPFVGRERELTALTTQLATAAAGEGGCVLLAGEPGIGKTRLLTEFSVRAAAAGWLVLAGRAHPTEGMPPYLPFIEALREYLQACPPEELSARLGAGAAEVALLVPQVRARLPALPPRQSIAVEHERYRLLESVTDFLLAIAGAAGRGLLLVLDDLHWADTPSLLLVEHLARRLSGSRLVLAGAYRTTDLGRAHPLADVLAELRRERLAVRVATGALSLAETTVLISNLSDVAPASGLAAAVHAETGGNAFFIEEVVQQLLAEGHALDALALPTAARTLPEGIREVVGRRLSRLRAATMEPLRILAVLGDGATIPVLQTATALAWEPLGEILTECVDAGILRETLGQYSYTHALIQKTVLEELSLPERQALHLRVGDAIEHVHGANLGPHIAALATHYRLAESLADPGKALAYARRAADAASAVFAWEDAVRHLQIALAEAQSAGGDDLRCELLLALGDAQYRAGNETASRAAFEQASAVAGSLGSVEQLARAALGYYGRWSSGENLETAGALLEDAARRLDGSESGLRAMVLSRLVELRPGLRLRGAGTPEDTSREIAAARQLARQAVAMARRVNEPAALLDALNTLHLRIWQPPYLKERCAVAAEMVAVAEDTGALEMALEGHWWLLVDVLECGDRAAVDQQLGTIDRLVGTLRQPYYDWLGLTTHAMIAQFEGRFVASEQLREEALRVGRVARGATAAVVHSLQRFTARFEQDRIGADTIGTGSNDDDLVAERRSYGDRTRPAYAFSELGRQTELKHELTAPTWLGHASDEFLQTIWLPHAVMAAKIQAGVANHAEAVRWYALLEPNAERMAVGDLYAAVCLGPVAYYLGLLAMALGHHKAAERHFAAALILAERMRAWPYHAHAMRALGALLLDRGESGVQVRAPSLLTAAEQAFATLGMTRYAQEVRDACAAKAAPTPRARPAFPDGLSKREVQVLRLVAEGKSNRDIAAQLVISERTVARHITNFYAKIGSRNRAHAALYAFHHGLTEPDQA